MPLDLNEIAGKTATTTVEFYGETARITYDPSVLTQENLSRAENSDDEAAFLTFFCEMVKAWDVTKGGRRVPLTVKGVAAVPLVFLKQIYLAIMRDAGDPDSGKVFSNGSPPKATTARARTGTKRSGRRSTSE